jgi:hypothetical protein
MDKLKLKNGDADELGRRYIGRQRMPNGRVRELWISEEAFQRRQQKAMERAHKVVRKNSLLRSERLAAKYGDKLNSAIGSLKRGMVRANGDIFTNYSRKGGKVREVWATPEAFARLQERTKKNAKKEKLKPRSPRLPFERKFHRGDIRDSDGMVFTNYTYRKDGRIKEVWLTPAAFERNTLAARKAARNRRKQLMDKSPERLIQESRDNYLKYRETYRNNSKLWRGRNRERVNLHYKKRRKEEPLYKLAVYLRCRLGEAIRGRGWKKSRRSQEVLGCTYEILLEHIEKQFLPGMTWENYGFDGWHIDHVIPLAAAVTEEELYKLAHFSNLRPLWAADNLSKNDIMPDGTRAGRRR